MSKPHVTIIGSDAVALLISKVECFTSKNEATAASTDYLVSRLHDDLKEILPGEKHSSVRDMVVTLIIDKALGLKPKDPSELHLGKGTDIRIIHPSNS